MKFPILGGVCFLLTGIVALAAVAMRSGEPELVASAVPGEMASEAPAEPVELVDAPEGAVMFSVPDMHCEFACAPKVRETLASVPGVEKVETNVEDQTATVFIGDGFDAKQAIAALTDANYPAKRISK